jgi:hypothetical protein
MTRCDLLTALAAAGVALRIEGDAIRYRAPRGALTPPLRAALMEHKANILFDFEERSAIREYDGGLSRAEAERLAAGDILNASSNREKGAK